MTLLGLSIAMLIVRCATTLLAGANPLRSAPDVSRARGMAGTPGWRLGWVAIVLALAQSGVAVADPAAARRQVIICQDSFGAAGTNLQSILMLLRSPDVEVLGIAVTSGDGWRDDNVAHLVRVLEISGRVDVPVYAGAVYPLLNSARRTLAWEAAYGPLVYKGAWTPPTPGAPRARSRYHQDPFEVRSLEVGVASITKAKGDAASFLARAVREHPHEVTIWCGAPMTDLALAARIDPEFASLAKELVFMGGSFAPAVRDKHFSAEFENNPRLEFNVRWDPEAASIVLREPWARITQVPIDATTGSSFTKAMFEAIAKQKTPLGMHLKAYGQSTPLWDEIAAAVWLDPTLVKRTTTLLVDVDTAFTAGYGNTLSWPVGRGPGQGERAVRVVQEVDVPAVERLVVSLLGGPR